MDRETRDVLDFLPFCGFDTEPPTFYTDVFLVASRVWTTTSAKNVPVLLVFRAAIWSLSLVSKYNLCTGWTLVLSSIVDPKHSPVDARAAFTLEDKPVSHTMFALR